MKTHTIIVGTSKSKEDDAYYIASKNKFWGLIHKSDLTSKQFEPEEYESFTTQTGIGFAELVFNKVVPKDKDLKEDLDLVTEGINDFIKYLDSSVAPKRIVFNGKTAAGWFFQYIDHGSLSKNANMAFNKTFKGFNFGILPRGYKNTEIYVLPNTSGAAAKYWDEKPWIQFWKYIKIISEKH